MINLRKLKNLNKLENEQHPFHLVDPSPWPIMTALSLLSLVLSFILYFHYYINGSVHFIFSFIIFLFFLFRWFKDIIIEATFEGHHTFKVQRGIKLGMILFIASEVMFVRNRKVCEVVWQVLQLVANIGNGLTNNVKEAFRETSVTYLIYYWSNKVRPSRLRDYNKVITND